MAEYQASTASVAETEKLAEQIGNELRGGEVIELVGDVGAGKTAFTRGLAKGIGSKDRVSSPTFTVNNIYVSPKLRLYHYDFYRLDDFLIIKNELEEVISNTENSVVLEWAEEIKNALPKNHIKISIQTQSEHERKFNISIPEKIQLYRGSEMILTVRTDKPEAEIGLYRADGQQIAYKKWQAHRELSATIHKVIYELLQPNGKNWDDIEGIVFYKGPGSFTGLRIGASVANALAGSNKASVSNQNGEDWIKQGVRELKESKRLYLGVALPEYGSEPRVTAQKK